MSERVKRSLSSEIRELFPEFGQAGHPNALISYKIGHMDGRLAAAELASEHEAIESALVEALEDLLDLYEMEIYSNHGSTGVLNDRLKEAEKARKALKLVYGETQ